MEETTPNYGIIPPTGIYGEDWPSGSKPTLPQGIHGELSKGGWSHENEGFVQQTFLGASISNFNINAGFGQSSTTLNVSLVNDEYNKSDLTYLGSGDDVYHNGRNDFFRPPNVGSPVFFKFGKNHATVDQAYKKTYKLFYGGDQPSQKDFPVEDQVGPINNIPKGHYLLDNRPISQEENELTEWQDRSILNDPDYDYRGWNHFVFGGILANYTKDEGSSKTFSVSVSDPREILSNVQVILNDYQATTFNNKNLLNVYGFLEYDMSKELKLKFQRRALGSYPIYRNTDGILIGRLPNPFTGEPIADCWEFPISTLRELCSSQTLTSVLSAGNAVQNPCVQTGDEDDFETIHTFFPITGQGFSRRCDQGIPWYRVYQGLKALLTWSGYEFGFPPCEYLNAGFGGIIDYRGFNYVLDLSGLPLHKIPQMYFLDTDQIDLLSLIQDVCQAISHDYTVSLLPVLDSPRTKMLMQYNKTCIEDGRFGDIITGIIRVDTIDKTIQPQYGTVTKYIETLEERGVNVETKNIGFETSNVTTDRFIAGHQEVNMYVFSAHKDSSFANFFDDGSCWTLDDALTEQIVPFYGFLDKNEEVVSLPKGHGPWQQILLDSSTWDTFGVGDYYVTTEIELRAAAKGFENWSRFLNFYNDKYATLGRKNSNFKPTPPSTPKDFADSLIRVLNVFDEDELRDGSLCQIEVPRCVWPSERNYMYKRGQPASPCAPPYGYPLYFKRAEYLGVDNQKGLNALNDYQYINSYLTSYPQGLARDVNTTRTGIGLTSTSDFFTWSDAATLIRENSEVGTNGITYREVSHFLEKKFQSIFGTTAITAENSLGALASAGAILTPNQKKKLDYAKGIVDFRRRWQTGGTGDQPFTANGRPMNQAELENIQAQLRLNKNAVGKISWLFNRNDANARKVHEYLSDIASRHLGKTYLVKIPKSTNLNYLPNQIAAEPNERVKGKGGFIDEGPYGFPPVPIVGRSYPVAPSIKSLKNPYLSSDYSNSLLSWDNGALRTNYNPINSKWEFNYKPETAGGYFDINLWSGKAKQLGIYPFDPKPFEEDGRISAYVRYPYSEHISLDEIGSESLSYSDRSFPSSGDFQAIFNEHHYDPRLRARNLTIVRDMEFQGSNFKSVMGLEDFDDIYAKKLVFVKCDISDKFYLLPKIVRREVKVFGDGFSISNKDQLLYNKGGSRFFEYPLPIYPGGNDTVPIEGILIGAGTIAGSGSFDLYGGYVGNKTEILDFERTFYGSKAKSRGVIGVKDAYNEVKVRTEQVSLGPPEKIQVRREFLGSDHVYALITLPGKVTKRDMTDGRAQQETNAMYYSLSECTVPHTAPGLNRNWERSFVLGSKIISLYQAGTIPASSGADLSNPEVSVGFLDKQPVKPDIAVLPLMSHERCYGPWLSASQIDSSSTRYSNIGGKVEYIKDESLSPWDYGGYVELNQAGILKAQFSNSLLLFSEKGSFTFTDAPAGLAIAQPLVSVYGPLVTSVNVSVGDSVKTTVSMDSFSPNFGQLKKQTEDFLADMAKEKRRLIDDRNRDIRDATRRKQKRIDIARVQSVNKHGASVKSHALIDMSTVQTVLSASVVKTANLEGRSIDEANGLDIAIDSGGAMGPITGDSFYNSASISDGNSFMNYSAGLHPNPMDYSRELKKTGMEHMNNFIVPFDNMPDNPSMANRQYISKSAIKRRMG